MKKNIRDHILNLIIVLLSLSMLTLIFLYAARSAGGKSEAEVFDKLWIVKDSEDTAFSVFDSSLCTPELIAYKQPGKSAGAVIADAELASTLYSVLSNVILDVLGSDSVCISEGVDYGDAANELIHADSFILFEYSADLPYPYIYALSSNQSSVDTGMCASGAVVYVSKFAFLISENENGGNTFSCIAFDSNENAYRFERTDKTPYTLDRSDKIHLDAYADSLEPIEFLSVDDKDGPVPLEIMHGVISYSPLQKSSGIDFLGLSNSETSAGFLELFEINPEKMNSYEERDGTTVFIGTDERVTVSPEKTVEFTSSDGSIPLKKILGYTPSTKSSYSLFDMLKATDVFINRFRTAYPEFVGKSAQIKLTGVYKNGDRNGNPVFEYSYYYNGIRIDTPNAFRFVFDSNGICEMSINLTGFTVMSEKQVTLSKRVAFERISKRLDSITDVRPIYTDSADGLYNIDWAVY